MGFRFKKGEDVIVNLPVRIVGEWGTDDRPLYQVEFDCREGTQKGIKKVKFDLAESQIVSQLDYPEVERLRAEVEDLRKRNARLLDAKISEIMSGNGG